MRMGLFATAAGGAAAALTVAVMWTAPLASATDFCDSLGNPAQIHDCNCGAANHPGTPEYQECLHGTAAVPGPADKPAP